MDAAEVGRHLLDAGAIELVAEKEQPVYGKMFPKGTNLPARAKLGVAESPDNPEKYLLFTGPDYAMIVMSETSGNLVVLQWDQLIILARAMGIDKPLLLPAEAGADVPGDLQQAVEKQQRPKLILPT